MAFPTKFEVEAKQRSAEYAAAREEGLAAIYRAYPTIPRHMANDVMIDHICAHFLGLETYQVAPSLSVFRSAVEEQPDLLGGSSGVAIEPIEKQKQKIISEIEELFSNAMSRFDLKIELSKLSHQTLEQVQARKAQIIERQRLSKLSVSQIKAELDAARPAPKVVHLPEEITREKIHAMQSWEVRNLVKKYGSAVNDRLFGRS